MGCYWEFRGQGLAGRSGFIGELEFCWKVKVWLEVSGKGLLGGQD